MFIREGEFPTASMIFYEKGCGILCEEQNESRRASGRTGTLSPRERVALASRVPHPIAMIERKDGTPGWLSGLLRERDGAEETVGIVTRTGSEEELIGRSVGSGALPELNGPYLVYLDGLASGISKRPQEFPGLWIEGIDPAPRGVVTDKNGIAQGAEVTGSLRNAPGRMKGAMDREVFD